MPSLSGIGLLTKIMGSKECENIPVIRRKLNDLMGSCASHSLKVDDPLEQVDDGCNLDGNSDDLGTPTGVEVAVPCVQNLSAVPCLQNLSPESSNKVELREVIEDEITINSKSCKQFDVVIDHSDHHYTNPKIVKEVRAVKNSSKNFATRIQNEWKILEKNLPETIYVRIYEDRMDILRAVIVGSAGTPYHDGLFFFDFYFPYDYPGSPPLVHYHSGGLRLNPNLYESGKVCLSLLNTWQGSGCERWSSKSTMLQVLISIQALVLNAKPYFNEPGYSSMANTPKGEKHCLIYNENTFLLSCKTMLCTLRNPLKNFEDFVATHFYTKGDSILRACRAYMAGAQVGSDLDAAQANANHVGGKNQTSKFVTQLEKLFKDLQKELTLKGVDCSNFLT